MTNYYTSINELQVGSKAYKEGAYSGITEFEVKSKEGDEVYLEESTDRVGYSSGINQNILDKLNDYGEHLFLDRESAVNFIYNREEERKNKVVDEYKDDLEGFSKWAIKRVYNDCVSSDYGDEALADAIKDLATIHFPDLEL